MSDPTDDAGDDLRHLLHDATADIRPRGSYDDIQARIREDSTMTTESTQARRWFAPSLIAAAVIAVVIGGAFWITRDDGSTSASSDRTPVAGAPTDTPTTGTPATEQSVDVFYVGEAGRGIKLFSERHRVLVDGAPAVAAVREAALGEPADEDYANGWPADVQITGVSFDGVGDDGVIGIQLSKPATRLGGAAALPSAEQSWPALQVEAIVRTAQAALGAKARVEFSVDGQRQDTVLGVAGPTFTAGSDDQVMAPVQITNLRNGVVLKPGKVTVEGVAATFEANVQWEVTTDAGAPVDSGFTTARECCTLAPYSFTTTQDLEPGTYVLTVHDTDESGEGGPVNADTKEFTVE